MVVDKGLKFIFRCYMDNFISYRISEDELKMVLNIRPDYTYGPNCVTQKVNNLLRIFNNILHNF